MEITIKIITEKSKEILATIPLSNYLRVSTIPVEFDESANTSYFNPKDFNIHLSLNNIIAAINGLDSKESLTEDLLEEIIRGLVYHELSHAIMTPIDLMEYVDTYHQAQVQDPSNNYLITTDLANIVEDERIETLLKDYYLKVNFKKNFKRICKLQQAKDFTGFVFNAVRFRYSPIEPKRVNALIDNFIYHTRNIKAMYKNFGIESSKLAREIESLLHALKKYFDEWQKSLEEQKKQQEQESKDSKEENSTEENQEEESSEENTQEESHEDSQENAEDEKSEEEQEDSKESNTEKLEPTDEDSEEPKEEDCLETEIEIEIEDLEEQVEEVMNTLKILSAHYKHDYSKLSIKDYTYNKSTKVELLKIIGKKCGFGIKDAPKSYGYSGKFNTKRFLTDHAEEMKWFEKKSLDETSAKCNKNNEKVLNIWLDNSGSYQKNDIETNKILRALVEIEEMKKDFRFNLITFNTSFTRRFGNQRISISNGSNCLPKYEIESLYKETNPNGNELNIILFDGEASCHRVPDDYDSYRNLKPFNNDKSIFITESSNTEQINKNCPKAKAVIEENYDYTSQLSKNIIKALNLLF